MNDLIPFSFLKSRVTGDSICDSFHLEDVDAVEHDGVHPAQLLTEHQHQRDDERRQVWAETF